MLIKTYLIFEVKVKALSGKYKKIFGTIVLQIEISAIFFNYKVVVLNIIQKFFKKKLVFRHSLLKSDLKLRTKNVCS